jgi:signal transduction histidine kinase/CheY-like chemotaxis protein
MDRPRGLFRPLCPNPGLAFAHVRQTLRRDPLFQTALAAGLLCLTASRLTSHAAPAWSNSVNHATDVLMLSLVLVAFLRGLRGLTSLERRFWQLLATGVGSWLAVTLSRLFLPASAASWAWVELSRSLGYASTYLFFILALALRPDSPAGDPSEEKFRWIDGLGLAFTAFGLFVYLSVIPWALGAAVWGTNVPKVVLYLALDGLLVLRLSARSLREAPVVWRATYRCLLVVALFWTATDGLEVLRWGGWLSEAALATPFDAIWLPPLLALVLAGRVRRPSGTVAEPVGKAVPLPRNRVCGSVLLGQALVLPLFHTLLVGLDVWEPGHHPASWLWALALPIGLGALSIAYLQGVERLAFERAKRVAETNHELALAVVALREARDEARVANEAKTRFLAAMSHEIRTPMNGVLGNVSLIQRTGLSASQRRLMETAHRSGQALLAVIDDILDTSRLEAGRLRLRCESFDVAATVEEVVESLGEVAREKGLELACLVEGLRAPLRGDGERFRQIVVNLVGNAIKYTERGEVAVFVRQTSVEGDFVTVAVDVADTGIGIPPEAAGLVFEPFGQAPSGRPSRSGTGLGLTISRQLAVLMGGDIRFESTPGRGSVFHLTVTLGAATEADAAGPVPPPPGRFALVVEPRLVGRFVLERQLAQLGIEARGVADAKGALEALRHAAEGHRAFDVVLIEASLAAAEDGALFRRLRADPASARARVVAVGVGADAPCPAGVTGTLSKPVLPRSLLAAISPAPDGEATALPSPVLPADAPTRRGLALIAEDNPVNQAVAEGMLGLLGFDAHVAANGVEALERIERIRYDVVLMDCMMPDMDGFQATAELRRRERARGLSPVPVVAVTAIAMSGDREQCLAAGMDDYLAKPFQIETLEATLARVLGRTRVEAAPDPVGADAA